MGKMFNHISPKGKLSTGSRNRIAARMKLSRKAFGGRMSTHLGASGTGSSGGPAPRTSPLRKLAAHQVLSAKKALRK